MSRVILVLGVHRSGTSAVAGVLHHLGVYMGKPNSSTESDLPPIDGWPTYASNPKGQFEDGNFCNINRSLLGPNWRDPVLPISERGVGLAELYANHLEPNRTVYGLKDPAICFSWKIWHEVLVAAGHKVAVLSVHRLNFDAAIKSLVRRDTLPEQVANHIMSRYWLGHLQALSTLSKKAPILKIPFETLLAAPEDGISIIADWAFEELEPPSPEQFAAAVSHIDPSLNHEK